MFATLTGPWPRTTPGDVPLASLEDDVAGGRFDPAALAAALDDAAAAVLVLQAEAGLELLTDGQLRTADLARDVAMRLGVEAGPTGALVAGDEPRRDAPLVLEWWRAAASRTELPVKQAIPGPYSLGRRIEPGELGREGLTLALADALAGEVHDLAEAGCPVVEVEEPAAAGIGTDEAERELFREAHARLLRDAGSMHATLAVTGGSADAAGVGTLLAAPYASLLVDLIGGPDNWRLVTATPGGRGIVCGALDPADGADDSTAVLVWAARYAASTRARGLIRVGLSNASSLAGLTWERAAAKLRALGEAARLASMPLDEAVRSGLDPRSLDARSAALGGFTPRPARRKPRGSGGSRRPRSRG
jgi:methionine synthase II (cobalamin-independent)